MSEVFGVDFFYAGFCPDGKDLQGKEFWNQFVSVDAFLSEDMEFPTEVTEKAVETGEKIALHVHKLPPRISISGVVTDTPIGLWNPFTGAFESYPGRRIDYADRLIGFWNKKQRVSISTTIGILDNYLFAPLIIKTKPEDGYSIRFTATMKHMNETYKAESQEAVLDPRITKTASPIRRIGTGIAEPF